MLVLRLSVLGLSGLFVIAAAVADDSAPAPESPYKWTCTYPYTDSTCAEMMSAWAKDAGMDPQSMVDMIDCNGCDPKFQTTYDGTQVTTSYDCISREGHDVLSKDVNKSWKRYREGLQGDGHKVNDWKFNACLKAWVCAPKCAVEFGVPRCVASGVYEIGRWTPELGEKCALITESDYQWSDSPDDGSGGYGSDGYGSGGYGSGGYGSGGYGSGGYGGGGYGGGGSTNGNYSSGSSSSPE